jgi:hypothetical protein
MSKKLVKRTENGEKEYSGDPQQYERQKSKIIHEILEYLHYDGLPLNIDIMATTEILLALLDLWERWTPPEQRHKVMEDRELIAKHILKMSTQNS